MGFLVNPFIEFPVAVFSPADISNLYAWYDASDSSTITKDGSNLVSKWENKEGTAARDIIQNTGGDKPTWLSADKNGKDVLNFVGNSFMNTASTLTLINAPITVFIVCKVPSAAGNTQIVMSGIFDGAGEDQVYHPFYVETDNTVRFSNTSGGTVQLDSTSAFGNWVYVTSISNGTGGFIRIDGSLEATDPSSPTGNANTFQGMSVGYYNVVESRWWNERIAEIVMYDKLLNGTEIGQVEEYLAAKWDI